MLSKGASGGLAILWDPRKVIVTTLQKYDNWMTVDVNSLKSNLKFMLTNIYGPISNEEKRKVWQEVQTSLLSNNIATHILGGDFNTILDTKEKYGGSQFISQFQKDFIHWVT